MNYLQTLNYLYTTLPMFSRIGSAAYKKDLTNITILCEHLGNPQKKFKSIHIAGTNGKGSVSHMLAAILQTSGLKTALYTSPHLYDFRERIKINGEMVSEEFVVRFVEKTELLIKEVKPSFFEITVAMAFDFFAAQEAAIAVIEVGLGGRLDSTNIIHPELSVITNIGWDHMNMLGNTLEEIAGEKGGIIKENVPVVIGEKHHSTAPVFTQIATDKDAPIYFAEDNFQLIDFTLNRTYLQASVKNKLTQTVKQYSIDLPGIYQTKNLLTVLQAAVVLEKKGWPITEEIIDAALPNTKKLTRLLGRWDIVNDKPLVVLEVAHNEDGIKQMLAHLQQISYHQLHIIFGTVNDKDAGRVLQLLPVTASYYFTQAHIPRALAAQELKKQAAVFGLSGEVIDDVNIALQKVLKTAAPDDLIIVCGSIFLVAEVNRDMFSGLINVK